ALGFSPCRCFRVNDITMNINRAKHLLLSSLIAVICASAPALAQDRTKSKDVEWPTYASDLAGTRYRPMDQSNASNFSKLEVAWRFKTDNLGNRAEYKLEGTPLMVNHRLYATAGSRRAVIALDPTTGELLWVHGENEGPRGAAAPRQLSGRGLAYWSDGRQSRIVYVTPGYQMVALDAKTGVPVAGFGTNGVVDLKTEDDQQVDLVNGEIGLHATPISAYYGGNRPGQGLFGESIVALDLKTGVRKWHFQLVHHGIWDHDIPCAPILADITVNGQKIKAIAQPTKQNWLYVFDRTNGK